MDKRMWYLMDGEEILAVLGSSEAKGLSSREAERRLAELGPNELQQAKRISPVLLFIAQFKDFIVLVLILAALISGMLGEYADAITILAIIAINAILGFIQEFRAEKSLEALKKLTAPEAKIVRDGKNMTIGAQELVPGDVLYLETGDRIPADARLLHIVNLEVDESTLTGESHPVKKTSTPLAGENIGLGDRTNMVFLGSVVTTGRARGVVTATGMNTEMGQIAGMIQEAAEEETPLQKRLTQLGKLMVVFCLAICVVVVLTGIWRGEAPFQMFLAGVSLAVAAIPEGLPAIVTVALAIGVQKMIKRNAIIRKLPAVETLGCATVICADKTGTLTQNEMTARQVYCDGKTIHVAGHGYEPKGKLEIQGAGCAPETSQSLQLLFKCCALCNNSSLKRNDQLLPGLLRNKNKNTRRNPRPASWEISGDPTEGALLVLAAKAGTWREQVEKSEQRIGEIPFDSDRKRMAVIYTGEDGKRILYVKGAPDIILNLCDSMLSGNKKDELTECLKQEILEQNNAMAGQALRVLGFAYRELPREQQLSNPEALERQLVFLGLAGMIDPPRPSAIRAIQVCKQAGIKAVMITGDHQITARAVAEELGLISKPAQVVTGTQIDSMTEEELLQQVKNTAVYARVSPKHKLRIVKALKQSGEVVAMTGDGVNDAPAVKEADIGVAMGKTGTDVTKEASAMVLADDNFATIVAAVEEGRAIHDNIRKFIRYLLSCNVGEVLTMFLAALLALPLPLLPIQILWVNLVTDGLPAMALGVDNADSDIMYRKPRHPKESVFSHGLWRKIGSRGLQIGLGTLAVFMLANSLSDGNLALARTMAFATLVFSQLFHVFDCKSERHPVFQVGFFSNPYLVAAVCCSISMELAVIYLPVLQPVFKTVALNELHWCIILLAAGWRTIVSAFAYYIVQPLSKKLVYLKA